MIESVLIVCVGNICRSPAVEKLFQHILGDRLRVSSAGLGALEGHGIDSAMERCLSNDNINDLTHAARQFTREMASAADLILVMELEHLQVVQRMAPEAAGKTMLLGRWDNDREIADPYRKSDEYFAIVYAQIKAQVNLWVDKLF